MVSEKFPTMNQATQPKLGIAITTLNRREMVLRLVKEIRRLTRCPYDLVICDDGSTDGTTEALEAEGEIVIGGKNKGVAWNKNRGIYYLSTFKKSDVIILLDDDIFPIKDGWDTGWLETALKYGHVNFAFPDMRGTAASGSCVPKKPGLVPNLGGPCIAFSRYAWTFVGYMDSRFKRFGHEHTEFSNRFLACGFGGIVRERDNHRVNYYFVIDGGLEILSADTNGSPEYINENQKIWEQIQAEKTFYRLPWSNTEQKIDFVAELDEYCGKYGIEISGEFGIFRDVDYLERNTDVKSSSFDAWYHFENFGILEGRKLR